MKRTVAILTLVFAGLGLSSASADTHLWLTTEGAGLEMTTGHELPPPPPPPHRHHHHHHHGMSAKEMRKLEKKRKKEMKKAAKRRHREVKRGHEGHGRR